ncbi:MAG: thiol peroxidase [Defluviitaleaceae bacterium]|nr:thiol peroxidase [Defluviitaleaceae bacterium]
MQVTFQGNPLTLEGSQLEAGQSFPDFTATKNDLSKLTLADTKGVRIFLTVPSLDTPVCDTEVTTFNKRAAEIDGVEIYTISADLPFAQARWCGATATDKVITASDYNERSFSKATGTFIKELALLTRAAFVVDTAGKIVHVEYLKEITEQPNFDAIINAAKGI